MNCRFRMSVSMDQQGDFAKVKEFSPKSAGKLENVYKYDRCVDMYMYYNWYVYIYMYIHIYIYVNVLVPLCTSKLFQE